MENSNTIDSQTSWAVFFNHFDPDHLYICKGVDSNEAEEFADKIGWNYSYDSFNTNFATISWNDESYYSHDLIGDTFNDIKMNDLKSIEEQMKKHKDDIANGYACIESDIFGGDNEWEGDYVKNMTAQDFLDGFIEIIEDSVVDGDSGYCYAVIDANREEIYLGGNGSIEFIDFDEFKSNFSIE